MQQQCDLKESLVDLLLEEYKQICLFEDLKERGIHIEETIVQICPIVFDLIGFPKEKTYKYDISKINIIRQDLETLEPAEELYFERGYLFEQYYDVIESIKKHQHIEVVDSGLKMIEYVNLPLARKELSEFVDWLYVAFNNFENMYD